MKIANTLTSFGTFKWRQDFIPNSLLIVILSFVVVESCADFRIRQLFHRTFSIRREGVCFLCYAFSNSRIW
jgi:hypothetical protein